LNLGDDDVMHAKYWAPLFLGATLISGVVRAEDQSQGDLEKQLNEAQAKLEEADVEKELKEARKKLEEAAHEVAELSTQLGKPFVDRLVMMGEGPGHAVIGVQLDSEGAKDGAHVRDVSPGGPAAEAGIRAGDVIVAINGTDVKAEHSSADITHLMRKVEPNSKVKIHVLRAGKPLDFEVTTRPSENAWGIPGMPKMPEVLPFDGFNGFMGGGHGSIAGMELATLTPQLGTYFGTDKGVLVLRAPKNATFNLQDGDVILSIDGREPTSGSHATRILASYQPGEKVKLDVMRQKKKMSLETMVPQRQHMKVVEPVALVESDDEG
jgi:C-terminal processing protease CtpA/Prc